MRTKELLPAVVVALMLSLATPQHLSSGPTAEERQQMQQMINRGNALRQTYEIQRLQFVLAGTIWELTGSEEDRQTALQEMAEMDAAEAALKANRDSTIEKVDSTFDTGIPAGTDIQYDPNCGKNKDGYTSARCYIRLCEGAFKDAPDWVASTKIHEYEHVKQKARGEWGIGVPSPAPCTFLYHWHEVVAYNAELSADFGCKTKLTKDLKDELWKRKRYHILAALRSLVPSWLGDKIVRVLPGSWPYKAVTIANESDSPRYVYGTIENHLGWPTYPQSFSFFLDSEQETTFTVEVMVPHSAKLGIGNEVWCHSYSATYAAESGKSEEVSYGWCLDQPDTASDFFFINVTATVDLLAGPDVTGLPGAVADFDFTVENLGTTPDSFAVYLTSVLGWPLTEYSWTVALDPSESVELSSSVGIPDSLPYTTDLVFCRAASLTSPAQSDSAWLGVMVEPAQAGVGDASAYAFALMPNAPNPFSAITAVRFSLPVRSSVSLSVYDVQGRLVRTLVDSGAGSLAPGIHTVQWDGKDNAGHIVASGVYFSALEAAERHATRKMVLLR